MECDSCSAENLVGQDNAAGSASENGSTECEEGKWAGPLAHVLFFDNIKSRESRRMLEDYIINLCRSNTSSEIRHNLTGCHDNTDVSGSVTYYDRFCVDILGEVGVAGGEDIESSRVVYGQVYMEPFWIDPVTEREERRLRRMAIKCFNCGDYHHLDDCPMPRDMARILEERQAYKANLGPAGADTRYHLTSSDKQLTQFCPGQISDRLRWALNLSPGDYPPYIRRMVVHGYPPGYRLLEKENYLTLINEIGQDKDSHTHQGLEIIYPGFNDKSHTGALDLKINPVHMETSQPTTTSLDEELGHTFDYEFEEYQLDGGEQVVEFKVKEKSNPQARKKCFSLDFPPGLVHLDKESQSTPGQTWANIKTLLVNKKRSKL